MRVLIVEDVPEMQELLRQFVGSLPGIQVSGVVGDGWQARVEIERRRPDLVLLDEILPGESSTDLLLEWVADGLSVMLMTGMDEAKHGLPKGAAGRLSKPDWRALDLAKSAWTEALLKAVGGS